MQPVARGGNSEMSQDAVFPPRPRAASGREGDMIRIMRSDPFASFPQKPPELGAAKRASQPALRSMQVPKSPTQAPKHARRRRRRAQIVLNVNRSTIHPSAYFGPPDDAKRILAG